MIAKILSRVPCAYTVGPCWLCFIYSSVYIREGSGNPLQCSCLENPRDGGAWWAAVYGVARSWTQLKRRSTSRVYMLVPNS